MILRYDQGMTTHHEPIDHPLTEAAAVEMWDASPCPEGYEFRGMLTVEQDATLYAMRAAFDAGREHERTTNPAADADRPWEPLNGGPVRVGDEVRRDHRGMTTTAVVGRVDGLGDPWTAEGGLIRVPSSGTWYVRRHVQELPTEPGAVIVPAEGCAHIEASAIGGVWRAKEAALGADGMWHGVWRRVSGGVGMPVGPFALPEIITPGTWQVADQ